MIYLGLNSLFRLNRECAAEMGMVWGSWVLNRVYNWMDEGQEKWKWMFFVIYIISLIPKTLPRNLGQHYMVARMRCSNYVRGCFFTTFDFQRSTLLPSLPRSNVLFVCLFAESPFTNKRKQRTFPVFNILELFKQSFRKCCKWTATRW